MDKIDYGLLLVRQEELTEVAAKLKAKLKAAAAPLKKLAEALEQNTDTVAFINAPIEQMEYTIEVKRKVENSDEQFPIAMTKFDWQSVDVRTIAPITIELNNALDELYVVKQKIAEMKRSG